MEIIKRKNPQNNGYDQNNKNQNHPKKYKYDTINGRKVGKGWLEPTQDSPMPVQNYRSFLLGSLDQARNRYLERLKQQGQVPNPVLMKPINKSYNLKTVDPDIPNFSSQRKQLFKFSGACIKSMYSRFFTVDSQNFKYYVGEKDPKLKKALELKDAQAFMQEKSEFMDKQKAEQDEKKDEWVQPNQKFRIGILLQGRKMKPIYYYTSSLYEAKFLLVNIQLYGNQYKAATMSNSIELSYLIEKASRFQKVMRLMCFVKEKRFVQMHRFQQISVDLIDIAQQSLELGRDLALKWFVNMLDEEDKLIIRSAFRSANPRSVSKSKVLNETQISKLVKFLSKFIQNRKMVRQQIISKEINRQIYEETTGITLQSIQMNVFNQNKYDNILQIDNQQASIIFDAEESYKYMIIENKTLLPASQSKNQINQKKNQAQNLIKKVDIGQVSYISTDLDQQSQFDYNNKLNKQQSYKIRLYGPLLTLGEQIEKGEQLSPSQIGYDYVRIKKKQFKISITKIKFPAELAKIENEKVTLYVKVMQFANVDGMEQISFDTTSQCIKIRGNNSGVVYPNDQSKQQERSSAIFNISKISNLDNEYFSLGLVIRKNEKPIYQCTERLLEHDELLSQNQRQIFNYKKFNSEQIVSLKDKNGKQYEITFLVENLDQKAEQTQIQEKTGKRLLVGRYVFYQGRINYVRGLNNNSTVDIIDTFSKKERKVQIQNLQLIENHGVNIFKLDKEPNFVQTGLYDWIIELKVNDKRILNQIHSKIQIRQAHLAFVDQDYKIPENLNTIEGDIVVSLMEIKGLISPDEINRRQINTSNKFDFFVELRLENFKGKIFKNEKCPPVKNQREINWSLLNLDDKNKKLTEPTFQFKDVKHSKNLPQSEFKIEKSSKSVRKALKKTQTKEFDEEKKFLHFIVKSESTGTEIGAAKIELDQLIDVNLNDLAKEYCVCLNRSHILEEMMNKLISQGIEKEKAEKQLSMFTLYSGIIRFQTLFQPTKDTCLRFVKLRETTYFKTPKQLLHFENLLQKSDIDNYKFKIPQISYNPNIRNLGENFIDLQHLILQAVSIPTIQSMLKKLQTKGNAEENKSQVKTWSNFDNQKINEQIINQIDQKIKFQSPFEQINILLKLQRKERPFIEPIFFNFKNIWEIYKQLVKNQAFDSLNLNEWLSFIDELSGKHNFNKIDEIMEEAFEMDSNDLDKSDALTQKSFVGDMVKQMHSKAVDFGRKSIMRAQQLEQNSDDQKNFSLVLCKEWQKEGNQSFIDLVNLIKCGIPQILRIVVWSDLMKTNLIAIEEKKAMIKNYPNKYNKQVSVFQNFVEISMKYDCVAFRQIDQDIREFRFPAFYFDDNDNEGIKQAGINELNSYDQKINRANKLKQDKQKMRKLLRILVVWGKTFKYKGVNYQFCYPTGFLKFAHRLINLMSIEEAFWIVIGMVRQYPRLWCLQESSLLDDAKSIFRFEHTVIRAILEADFPKVAQKLYDLGLPVEILIYDSLTSLYCDQFHSDTLLRIWDQLIFYLNTTDQTSRRRGIWLILAPALLIIQQKEEQILRSQTVKEVIQSYNDGCGINYNPNHIIQLLNDLIDDVFVTEGKQTNKILQNASNLTIVESGGTGSGNIVQTNRSLVAQKNQSSGFLSGIFSVFGGSTNIDQAPQKIDLIRKKYQEMQNLIFENQKFKNKIVSEFLFGLKDMKKGQKNQQNSDKKVIKDDDMDFEDDNKYKKDQSQSKPNSHQFLDYKRWRVDILSKLNSKFLKAEEILDDDLNEFEDKDIYNKQQLEINQVQIYLHNLQNWYGTASQQSNDFKIQVQYGKLNSNGNFDVKNQSKDDQSSIKNEPNLQYYCNFDYKNGYNYVKIKILSVINNQSLCHCYCDLRGLQRGKIIQIQLPMNSKEYTQNAESQFSLTYLQMSLFLVPKKDENRINSNKQDSLSLTSYLSSIKKIETNYINIYNPQKEKTFQNQLFSSLQASSDFDNQNFKQFLSQELVNDILSYKYKFLNISPFDKYGNLSQQLFKDFLAQCLPDYYSSINFTDLNQLYKDFLFGKSNLNIKQQTDSLQQIFTFDNISKVESKQAILDTEKVNETNPTSSNSLIQQNEKYFSLRSFIVSVLFQSPVTVQEKLDILYDVADIGNQNIDGIDLDDALMIYQTVLQQHQYFLPYNELRTSIENVYNQGEVSGIVGAFWTSKMLNEIKFDISKESLNVIKLEEFINQSTGLFQGSQVQNNQPIIELTSEIQQTVQMYQNLYGSKSLDFNQDTSPFKHINNLLAGTGKRDLGETLFQKTLQLGDGISKKYRICLISVIHGGERIVTEIKYNLQSGALVNEEFLLKLQKNESQSFKKLFIRNQNVLDLSVKQKAIGKNQFLLGSKKIPFVCDLLRAETIWQDRKLDSTSQQERGAYQLQSQSKISSMRMKKKFLPVVNIFLSDKEKIFIFKFENKVMGGKSDQTSIKELVPKQIYLFELEALYLEDIILDMRDRITKEIQKVMDSEMYGNLSENFVSEIEGKMEFFVRKIAIEEVIQQKQGKNQQKIQNLKWNWKSVNDFDRIQKFSDDEVFEDEVIFKLIKSQSENEELLDQKSQAFIEGYDCFSIYKHQDNSYEWRLCKIVGKQMRPEYKNLSMEAFEDIYRKKKSGKSDVEDRQLTSRKMNEVDQFYYFLEFYHLKEQGKEMWIKRRREDVIFSARYSRDQQSFEQNCFKFIMENY